MVIKWARSSPCSIVSVLDTKHIRVSTFPKTRQKLDTETLNTIIHAQTTLVQIQNQSVVVQNIKQITFSHILNFNGNSYAGYYNILSVPFLLSLF